MTSTDAYVLVTPSESLCGRLGIPRIGLPVRSSRVDAVLTNPVSLAQLVTEVDDFVQQHPESADRYGRVIGTIASLAAREQTKAGEYDQAEALLRRGLVYGPSNRTLRTSHGLALWGQGRREEALAEFLSVIEEARSVDEIAPMLWVITAKALRELQRPHEGLALLQEVAAVSRPDAALAQLMDALRSDVAVGESAPQAGSQWCYVLKAAEVRSAQEPHTVVGALQPGTWYLAHDQEAGWVRVTDPAGSLEGWVPQIELHVQEPPRRA